MKLKETKNGWVVDRNAYERTVAETYLHSMTMVVFGILIGSGFALMLLDLVKNRWN